MSVPKPVWKEHPLYLTGAVEEVPIAWVWQYWTADVTANIENMHHTQVDMTGLWDILLAEGMRDPLIIRVGLENKRIRLEAGNHRIQLLRAHGVELVPVTIQVRHLCGQNAPGAMTDGTVAFDFPPEGLKITEITQEYMKPSDVFWHIG